MLDAQQTNIKTTETDFWDFCLKLFYSHLFLWAYWMILGSLYFFLEWTLDQIVLSELKLCS